MAGRASSEGGYRGLLEVSAGLEQIQEAWGGGSQRDSQQSDEQKGERAHLPPASSTPCKAQSSTRIAKLQVARETREAGTKEHNRTKLNDPNGTRLSRTVANAAHLDKLRVLVTSADRGGAKSRDDQ